MTTSEIDRVRTELEHARETADPNVSEQLEHVVTGLERLQEADESRPDRIESVRDELAKLEDEADDDTWPHIQRAWERLAGVQERLERGSEDGTESGGG